MAVCVNAGRKGVRLWAETRLRCALTAQLVSVVVGLDKSAGLGVGASCHLAEVQEMPAPRPRFFGIPPLRYNLVASVPLVTCRPLRGMNRPGSFSVVPGSVAIEVEEAFRARAAASVPVLATPLQTRAVPAGSAA